MELELDSRCFRHGSLGLAVGAVYPVTVLERSENGFWNLRIGENVVEAGTRVPLQVGSTFWVRVNAIHPTVVLKMISPRKGGELVM